MNPTETAEQLRQMRTRAVLCYNDTPSGPVYSIHATVTVLGVLSGAADLIEAQAAMIAELQEANKILAEQQSDHVATLLKQSERIEMLRDEVRRACENEQTALNRAARARLDFQREFHGQLQEAIAAEREACAHIVECKALCRVEAAAKIRSRGAT